MAKEYHKTTNREKRTKSIKKCANLTRFKPRTRRHRKDPLLFYRVAGQPNIHNIPNEILLHIFQYLTQYELWSSVRSVCKLWKSISECACFWQQIEATQEMPLNLLIEWQKAAPGLKLLKIENRNDADFIIEQASKSNRQLETIKVLNCWGNSFHPRVKATPLCNLLKRCSRLKLLDFSGTEFKSCKFYELVAKYNTIHSKRPSVIRYFGNATPKQIRAFLQAQVSQTNDYAIFAFDKDLRESLEASNDWNQTVNDVQDLADVRYINTHDIDEFLATLIN